MFLKCFWLLRKPSDQKNIFIDEQKCVDLVVNYMKIFKFCGSPLNFKKFLGATAPSKIKNFRGSGDA